MSFYRRSDGALTLGHTPTNLRAQIPQRDILAELVEEDMAGEGEVAKALPVRRRCAPVKAPFCILDPVSSRSSPYPARTDVSASLASSGARWRGPTSVSRSAKSCGD